MRQVQRIDPVHPDVHLLDQAAKELAAGHLVAYPTETFYGLGADPCNAEAVEKIFVAKGRPERMALPLIAPDDEGVALCVREFPEAARKLAKHFWPGALTLVLPASDRLPSRLLGGARSVALRLSPHPVAAGLARAVGASIIATSANRSGRSAPVTAAEVVEALGEHLTLVLDGGPATGGAASTVLDLTADPPRVVRSGAVPISAIEAVLGRRLA